MAQGGIISAVLPADASFTETANVLLKNVICLSTVYVGAVLRMNSSGVAINAIADSLGNSNMIGICESKTTSTLCDIRVLGTTPALYSGLDVTKEYFLSSTVAGGVSSSIPSVIGSVVLRIGQPFSANQMLVLKGQRSVRA